MKNDSRIFVAGHGGLVGSAVVRRLRQLGYTEVITASREELDLREQVSVTRFFEVNRPQYVVMAAAVVGGIGANSAHPARFIGNNLKIQTNVIDAAYQHGVEKFCFLASNCIYPRLAPQPIREEYLLTGELDPSNQAYAVAKIAGIEMCRAYAKEHGFNAISLVPANMYGPGDNFDPETSHVIPALLRRFLEAKEAGQDEVVVWGTGQARREFLYVEDFAQACEALLRRPARSETPDLVNVGTGQDISIAELVDLIAEVTGYSGRVSYDTTRPDGTMRKALDVSRIKAMGWEPETPMREGLARTLDWYLANRRTGGVRC